MRRVRNSAEFQQAFAAYKSNYALAYEHLRSHIAPPGLPIVRSPPPYSTYAGLAYIYGRTLVHIVLQQKRVPADKARAFEKAFREFTRKRAPKDGAAWFVKNFDSAQLLLETESWPDKSSVVEDDRTFKVGAFVVHNQTHIDDVRATAKLLTSAEEMLRSSKIPNVTKVLYGDVFFVGEIERKKTVAARYYDQQDVVAILLVKRFEAKALHVIIHELGHRYWKHVYQNRSGWTSYHTKLLREFAPTKFPAVGEHVPWIKGSPAVVRYEGDKIWFEHGFVTFSQYQKFSAQKAKEQRFPTVYSMTNAEEHFCEAFALYTLGELKEPHLLNFQMLVVNQRAANPKLSRLMR